VKGLAKLPDETVIDGGIIALDDDGRPSFNILQNYGSSTASVLYFVFDLMVLAGRDCDGRNILGAPRAIGEEDPAEAPGARPIHAYRGAPNQHWGRGH
jgi:hypothetical protein